MGAETAIAVLTQGADLRTWSLIVTIFGDLARAPGAEIPGPVLSAITGRIGVKPEAMRVALHRLRKDNWLTSRRDGRVSFYRLTDTGRTESERATGRIYALDRAPPTRWHILVANPKPPRQRGEPGCAPVPEAYIPVAPGTWLGPGPAPQGCDKLFAFEGRPEQVPDWLRRDLLPAPLQAAYAAFSGKLATAATALGAGPVAPLERAVLRVLVVHGWRRLVLRHPDLPDRFFPDDWQGPAARSHVAHWLARLGEPSISEIATVAS